MEMRKKYLTSKVNDKILNYFYVIKKNKIQKK